MNGAWAGTLARALVRGGLKHAVLSPGSRNTPVVLALHALRDRVTLHTVLDEREAGFFALGLARSGGAPVLLSCTSGSAGAHWLPALIEASESRVPLIAVTADRPSELQGFGAPQTIDQQRLFGAYVRLYRDLSEPNPGVNTGPGTGPITGPDAGHPLRWLEAAAAQAMDAATGALPGPVHLNLPFRKPLWSADEAPLSGLPVEPPAEPPARRVLRGPALPDADALDALAARFAEAERGVIVSGPRDLVRDRMSGSPREAVAALAKTLGWPIIAEPASQLRFGIPRVIASADALLRDEAIGDALAPDLILRFGRVPTSKSITQWITRHGDQRTVLVDPAGLWEDPTWTADTVVAADPTAFCQSIRARLFERAASGSSASDSSAWLTRWRAADAAADAVLSRPGHWEGPIARAVAESVPEGGLLHVASSMPIRDLDSFAPATGRAIAVAANRGANGIDGLIATAIGEAVAGGVPVAALSGDLSFLHGAGGLALARGLTTPVALVVIDNGGGGIFGILPISQHPTAFEPHFITPQGADIPALCAAAGVPCISVADPSGLRASLPAALETPGLTVLYICVDREENLARHREAWTAVALAAREVI